MIELKGKTREKKQNLKQLRKQGEIPAIVYSKGQAGENLSLDYIQFDKVYNEAGESSLLDLVLDGGKSKKVLIHDVQYSPVKNKIIHVDFYEVDLKKKVTAPVEIELVGEAPVVKSEGGIVIQQLKEIEIECLPTDLIKEYKVDISGLDDFSSAIHVKDLKISDKITILNDLDEVVVNISEPRKEEEETTAPVEGEVAEKETAETEKKEGEEKSAEESAKEDGKEEKK